MTAVSDGLVRVAPQSGRRFLHRRPTARKSPSRDAERTRRATLKTHINIRWRGDSASGDIAALATSAFLTGSAEEGL